MELTKKHYWFWFANIPGVGRAARRKLLDIFESPEELYFADSKLIGSIDFLNEKQKAEIMNRSGETVAEKYNSVIESGINITCPEDSDYPKRLRNIYDNPHILYYKGKSINSDSPSAAVIGARKCSNYGRRTAYNISRILAQNGVRVISGMACGVDGAAHRGCLDAGGVTYAVLGCGVNVCYPKSNIEIYMDIAESGSIISEYYPDRQPLAGYFPERNRLISALADVIIVVEAGERSGSLITVDCALEQGKEVFAVPGRIDDISSKGCNNLIKLGAALYNDISDVTDSLGIVLAKDDSIYGNSKQKNIFLAMEDKVVYDRLDFEPKHVNMIARETGLSIECVMKCILGLELRHIIKQTANNYYVKT